jgi:hypothetical protein
MDGFLYKPLTKLTKKNAVLETRILLNFVFEKDS